MLHHVFSRCREPRSEDETQETVSGKPRPRDVLRRTRHVNNCIIISRAYSSPWHGISKHSTLESTGREENPYNVGRGSGSCSELLCIRSPPTEAWLAHYPRSNSCRVPDRPEGVWLEEPWSFRPHQGTSFRDRWGHGPVDPQEGKCYTAPTPGRPPP